MLSVELSPETCRVKPLRRINAIVASCWNYFTIISCVWFLLDISFFMINAPSTLCNVVLFRRVDVLVKSACYLCHVRPSIRTCQRGFSLNSILWTFMKICRLVTPKQVREEDFWRVECQGLLGLLFSEIRHALSLFSIPRLYRAVNGTRMYSKNFWIEFAKPICLWYGPFPHYTSIALVQFRVASGLAYK